jgi:hypothetical protein
VEIARLPVVGDFARELHPGWRAAVILQRNVEWARALLGAPDAVADALLAAVLPLDERAAYAEGVARSAAPGDGAVVPLLAAVDGPWPGGLATAVLAYVERLLSTAMVRESSPLLQLIARRLPIRRPVLVETIQARLTTEDWADHQARAVGFDHPWRAALTSLSTTLSVRARVDDELRRSTP